MSVRRTPSTSQCLKRRQDPDIQNRASDRGNYYGVLAIYAKGSAAIDDVVAAAHVGSSLPACSRTMYSAYQSGQFASCWPPVRFSCSPCAAAARRSAAASSVDEVNVVSSASTRPGNRAVTSWNSQPLPSGSLNEAKER